jgi:ABC-2 type transport system ATP-binding protein
VPAVLEVEGLTKRYRDVTALDHATLSIESGEIFALLGPNGAGKTTLIGCVCGLVKKSEGRVKLFGADVEADPVKPRFDVGLVPQEINFDPFFTVRESLEIQLGYYGKSADPARIAEVLDALKLSDKAEAATRTLSGGMKRRLLIAKALVHRPKLVFLDEPTAGVDIELRRDLWAYVRKLRASGTTVVLTTHYLEEAEELADRVGIIDRGRLSLVEEKHALMTRLGERRLEVRFAAKVAQVPAGAGVLAPDGLSLTHVEVNGAAPATDVLRQLYAAGLPIADVVVNTSSLEEVLLRVLRGKA